MAFPWLLAAAAMAGGSMLANRQGDKKIRQARRKATDSFNTKQDELRMRAREAAGQTQDAFLDVPGQVNAQANEIRQMLRSAVSRPVAGASSVIDNASGRVVAEQQRRAAKESRFVDDLGGALATSLGYGTAMNNANLMARQRGMDLGQIGMSAQGNRGVLETALALAPAAGAGYQTLGDLLQIGSQMMMMGGLRAPPTGGAVPPPQISPQLTMRP